MATGDGTRDLLFINKSSKSSSLSQSQGAERLTLYKHVQRTRTKFGSAASNRRDAGLQAAQRNLPEHSAQLFGRGRRSGPLQSHDPVPRSKSNGHASNSTNQLLPSSRTVLMHSPLASVNSRPSYGGQLLGRFIEENVDALQNQTDFKDLQSFFWITNLPCINSSSSVLRSSTLALASAGMGQEQRDTIMIKTGSDIYAKAIILLRRAISQSADRVEDATIAACLTLQMYQFFASEFDRQHWSVHVQGLGGIIAARGPESFRSGLAHKLFVCCRANIVSSSLHRRKRTFLEEARWRTIPWDFQRKSHYERMIDCVAYLPGLGERFSLLNSVDSGHSHTTEHLDLLEGLWQLIAVFISWHQTVSTRVRPRSMTETNIESLVLSGESTVYRESYDFSSLASANMCRIFWASLIDIYNMLALTYETLSTTTLLPLSPPVRPCTSCALPHTMLSPGGNHILPQPISLAHDSHHFCTGGSFLTLSRHPPHPLTASANPSLMAQSCRSFAKNLADQVCMSLQYCLQPQYKTVGRYLTLLPLKLAIWCFVINLPDTKKELDWAYAVVGMLADTGMPFSANLFTDRPYFARSG